ncbi:MAG TPA: ferrous iron transport protein A [Sandaracinaceae bacterium LLY-WYZ-13_1]|nr:ferrous iron transport protein A [Sandaracinaceae bacterium LLY-WYZ-13_1]
MPDEPPLPTLADLPIGAEGTVVDVRCPRPVARRLMEMGVLPGTRVRVLRVAPLGDPIVLQVRRYSLSIRRREAADIVLSDVREAATEPEPGAKGATERGLSRASERPAS